MKLLRLRITDRRFRSLIARFLQAGVLESTGDLVTGKIGAPQGSIMSPVLANVYLHYALDEWFLKNETTSFIGRVGVGASQQVGGDDSDVKPELLGELDFEHKLTDRHTIGAFSGIYPDVSNFGEFRYIGSAYWDMALSETLPLKVRLGFEDRYRTDPDPGDKSNDLDYYASLIYDF